MAEHLFCLLGAFFGYESIGVFLNTFIDKVITKIFEFPTVANEVNANHMHFDTILTVIKIKFGVAVMYFYTEAFKCPFNSQTIIYFV